MKILLTGFEAFGSVEENPSQVLVEHMARSHQLPDGIDLVCDILPVEYETTGKRIRGSIQLHEPDAVVMLGVAQSRQAINLEYQAVNCDTATSPDNQGVKRSNQVIDYRFDHYFKRSSTLPLDYLFCEFLSQDIPVKRSYDAGGYLCNHVFYHALTCVLEECNKPIKTGFIHVPTFEAVDWETQLYAVHTILNVLSDPQIEDKQYRHPLIQAKLDELFAMMPDDPDWCSLVSVGGLHIAHSGQSAPPEQITAFTVEIEALGDRLLSDLAQGDFGFSIWGSKSDLFLIADLQVIPYLFIIKWSGNGSLSSVHLASKALPQAIKPLVALMSAMYNSS